nr:cathepsin L-like [Drosophila kikkawai]
MMNYFRTLRLIFLLLLVDLLGSAAKLFKSYNQILVGIDWRKYGYVAPVQNQNNGCQSSWAMSAVGALEAHLAIKSRRLVELSAQQLIDCSPVTLLSFHGKCGAGWPAVAFNYTSHHGIASKKSYPYRGRKSSCSYDLSTSVGRNKGYVTLKGANEKKLAEIVYNIGPVVVSIDGSHKSFMQYTGGIYKEPLCISDIEYLEASVLVVGFGRDPWLGDYWIIKNSFGRSWGENGYMRLARNAGNMCGVATVIQYPK